MYKSEPFLIENGKPNCKDEHKWEPQKGETTSNWYMEMWRCEKCGAWKCVAHYEPL